MKNVKAHLGVKHSLVIHFNLILSNLLLLTILVYYNSNENIYFNVKTEFCLECENGEWSLELAFLMIMTAAENF